MGVARARRWAGVAVVAAVAIVAGGRVQAIPTVDSRADALIQLERDWDAAFLRTDVDFIERVLADEFTGTYADGVRGDKQRELQLAAEFNQQIDSSTLDGFAVKHYGDAAVVEFTRHLVGPSKGRTLKISYQYTDVFVMRDGRWQCVTSHSTRVADN